MKRTLSLLIAILALVGCVNAQTAGENIDVTHYEIHLSNINLTDHTLQGETYVTLNATANTNTIVLELKRLTVNSVLCETTGYGINGFNQEDDFLTINLSQTLPAGQSLTLDILYGGNTFNETWGGIMWTSGYVCNMGVGFESIPHNLGKCWFPCVDNFTDKATYDVYVTVSTDLTAVCGGNFVNTVDNGDGTKTVHYNMPQEIATYHISFVVGNYTEWTDTYNGINGDIPITVYVKPSQINKVEGTFVHVKDIAEFFETNFGPYPFNRIGYSITSVGCMEHVDNIGITSGVLTGNTTQEEYVAHEMSHMWFGNKVTCSTAEDMWLNEGFAQFCGKFYRESVYGEEDFQQTMSGVIDKIAKWCQTGSNWIPLNNMPQTMTYDGNAVYDRGAVIVNTMMNYMGRENFLLGIRHYLESNAYSAASSEQLRDALTEATGIDMSEFFETFVFNGGMPHYAVHLTDVTPNGNQFDAAFRLDYQHVGSEHVGQNNRVEVTFVGAEGQTHTALVGWDGQELEQTLTLDFEPIAVFADYYNRFLDAKIEKNILANHTGNNSATTSCTVIVNSVSDSSMIRVENHFLGPDSDPGIPGLTLSTTHYWNVFRNDFGEASVGGRFQYTSGAEGDILHSANDSAVLLYRANVNEAWHSIPCGFSGIWMVGQFDLEDLQTGQYAIGAIDKTVWSVTEKPSQVLRIHPNPTQGILYVELTSPQPYRITNLTGQTLLTGSTQGQVDVTTLSKGTYLIEVNGKTQKFIIQ